MPKQEYKIQSFHGGTNNKFDPRDIGDDQNASSSLSVKNPGRLTLEGSAMTLYDKTGINPLTVTDVGAAGTQADPQGFVAGYGLFAFSHDYDMDSTPDEVDTEFVVSNDQSSINIYDPNKSSPGWYNLDDGTAKFKVGSRLGTVKPVYYNVDGALRVCDSNFGVIRADADGNNEVEVAIGLNDTTIYIDDGSSGTVTYATGDLIQINQEIMYITTGATAASFPVIRGFANTKISTHAINDVVYYVNVPKYFGHIKQDRLFECDTSNSINTWVEDVQTPQPPNNTRKSDGTTGTLAQSAGIQSLRVYDEITGSTSNYPTESEKVVLEFGDDNPDYGIIAVSSSGEEVTITTSGNGSSETANHGLLQGDEIVISNVNSALTKLGGTHEVKTVINATSFTIDIEGYDEDDLDYASKDTAIQDWADYSATVPGTLQIDVTDTELPTSGQFWVHITAQTGVASFNGVYLATANDNDQCYFKHASYASADTGDNTGQLQQLLGTITRPGEDAIDEDLKRKWNFAMSFTYDGPGQEVQESLLTQGYKITAALQDTGAANLHALGSTVAADATTIVVDDGDVFSAGDVIMIESEQIKIDSVSGNNLTVGLGAGAGANVLGRGWNGSAAATHADNLQVYKVEELTSTATVDWTGKTVAQKAVIKSVYNHGVDEKTWNARINGFKIYMRDVTDGDASKEWRLFSHVNFNKGTYTLFAADDSELILEQPATSAIATLTTGTSIKIKPVDTYLSENLFTEETIIDAQYKAIEVVGRRAYIGNIRQGGRTYPDRMLRTPVNKFDTFPETNYIDVAVGDGDSITALKSFGDRLLQFKKNKVYIINVAGESEVLEAEYNNAGISFPSQVTKTNDGIAWINAAGLWYFDGKQVQNLTVFVEDEGYDLGSTDFNAPKIAFDKKNNRLIYTPIVIAGLLTKWYIYDLDLKSYQGPHMVAIFPYSYSNNNYYTNMINDSNGDLIVGYVDDASNTELNFFKWNNDDKGHQLFSSQDFYLSKDIDLGSPGIRKKIYKVYVTYKCTGHSGVKMQYATDGGSSFSDFSSSRSTNYDITAYNKDTFTAGEGTGFKNSSGAWAVAELKPSSSINNIKSIQLKIKSNELTNGTATGGSTNTIELVGTSSSTTDSAYVNYNIYIYGDNGRYNSRRISIYDGDGGEAGALTATVASSWTDKGYTNSVGNGSDYILGSIAPDFEINDITIVYRMKRVK